MEEPEDGCSPPQPVVFRAESNTDDGQFPAKKVQKKGILKRTKDKNSTPKLMLKGAGRKRFSFSPSPALKQVFKKSAYNDLIEYWGRELRNKRNLLAELSKVADIVNIPPPESSRKADDDHPLDMVLQVQGEIPPPPVNECREMVTIPAGMGGATTLDGQRNMPCRPQHRRLFFRPALRAPSRKWLLEVRGLRHMRPRKLLQP